ncbi:MAG: AbrB/MazE/SpoVT family DNA-binding domain-containing protein, partial [Candidatus Desulfofervidus sp.]|nr:AbrB/MazE/SpoVT family DNA-binding domain-containing protein [Candidatus Desulfofervidus sp.]
MTIAVIDEKGRIQIPEKIREELYLKPGEELEIKKEGK